MTGRIELPEKMNELKNFRLLLFVAGVVYLLWWYCISMAFSILKILDQPALGVSCGRIRSHRHDDGCVRSVAVLIIFLGKKTATRKSKAFLEHPRSKARLAPSPVLESRPFCFLSNSFLTSHVSSWFELNFKYARKTPT